MKLASARSRRASAPFRTTNRAPEIFCAASKSIRPSASPISKCCFGVKSSRAGVPTLRTSTLPVSSAPSGTSARGRFGMTSRAALISASSLRSSSSPLAIVSLRSATSAINRAAVASSFAPLALPISFEAAFRRDCASCSAVSVARRLSSSATNAAACGASPRRCKLASKASALSLIHLMSNTVGPRHDVCVKGRRIRCRRSGPAAAPER